MLAVRRQHLTGVTAAQQPVFAELCLRNLVIQVMLCRTLTKGQQAQDSHASSWWPRQATSWSSCYASWDSVRERLAEATRLSTTFVELNKMMVSQCMTQQ